MNKAKNIAETSAKKSEKILIMLKDVVTNDITGLAVNCSYLMSAIQYIFLDVLAEIFHGSQVESFNNLFCVTEICPYTYNITLEQWKFLDPAILSGLSCYTEIRPLCFIVFYCAGIIATLLEINGTLIITVMFETATYVLTEYGDPRTKHWVLASFKELVFMLAIYIWFCLVAGPRYMKTRPPFELKKVILAYNLFQVLFSVFLVYQAIRGGWFNGYSFTCAPLDRSDNPNIMNSTFWWYLLAKYTEFFDTIFFVLRKRTRQVSPLHVFHHVTVPIVTWIGVRYFPNGHGTAYLFLNSLVHIVMYSYYFLTCLNPQDLMYKKIKKYITQIQMVQFTILMLHNVIAFFGECDFPKGVNILVFSESAILMVFFSKFYFVNYCKSKKT